MLVAGALQGAGFKRFARELPSFEGRRNLAHDAFVGSRSSRREG
jgi:hypothetical protein